MHPFTPDLSNLDDEELLTKINELYSKMRMAMNNPPVYQQMCAIMDDYQLEQKLRLTKQKDKLDNSELSKKIDIGK